MTEEAAVESTIAIVATKAGTRRRGGTSLMSPGKKRAFALGTAVALATTAFAAPVAAQMDNVDDLMISQEGEYAPAAGMPGGSVVTRVSHHTSAGVKRSVSPRRSR